MSDNGQDFGKVRALLWPIHGFELKKFLPMSLLMAAIIFVYTLVRDLKDTFIQKYAVLGGTELISALKLWFVLPMAFVVVIVFSTLVSTFGMRKTFYIVCSFYTIFFAVFAWILFPNADKIHLSKATMEAMRSSWPSFSQLGEDGKYMKYLKSDYYNGTDVTGYEETFYNNYNNSFKNVIFEIANETVYLLDKKIREESEDASEINKKTITLKEGQYLVNCDYDKKITFRKRKNRRSE